MAITISKETVFDVGADCIVNTVNCDGFMGRGLALEFALRYPKLEEEYKEDCKNQKVKVGKLNLYQMSDVKVLNFPTKDSFKYPSKMEYIIDGLKDFKENYKNYNVKKVAFPLLGAQNGQLNYKDVIKVINEYLKDLTDVEVVICTSQLVSVKEQKMLDVLKEVSMDELSKAMRLTSALKEELDSQRYAIKRFSHLLRIDGLGTTTYRNLYNFCATYQKKEKEPEQMSLF